MLAPTFKYIFDRDRKAPKPDDLGTIELYMYFDGVKRYRKVAEVRRREWDDGKQEVNRTHSNRVKCNRRLRDLKTRCENFYLDCINSGKWFTIRSLVDHLDGKEAKSETLNSFIDRLRRVWLKDLAVNTVKNHDTLIKYLNDFDREIEFGDVDYAWLRRFHTYMRSRKTYRGGYISQNTALNMHRYLKKYLKEAIKQRLLLSNPYDDFDEKAEKKEKTWLTKREISLLEELDLSGRHGKVMIWRDMFVFSCYTGLRFSDLVSLRVKHINEEKRGLFLRKKSVKTKVECEVPLKTIFNGRPWQIAEPYLSGKLPEALVFEKIDNKTANAHLKDLAGLAGINKHLVTKMGRHTCGTNLRNDGVSKDLIQKILGHENIASTEIYAQTTTETVINELEKVYKKIS